MGNSLATGSVLMTGVDSVFLTYSTVPLLNMPGIFALLLDLSNCVGGEVFHLRSMGAVLSSSRSYTGPTTITYDTINLPSGIWTSDPVVSVADLKWSIHQVAPTYVTLYWNLLKL